MKPEAPVIATRGDISEPPRGRTGPLSAYQTDAKLSIDGIPWHDQLPPVQHEDEAGHFPSQRIKPNRWLAGRSRQKRL